MRRLHASIVKLAEKNAWPASEPTNRSSFDMAALGFGHVKTSPSSCRSSPVTRPVIQQGGARGKASDFSTKLVKGCRPVSCPPLASCPCGVDTVRCERVAKQALGIQKKGDAGCLLVSPTPPFKSLFGLSGSHKGSQNAHGTRPRVWGKGQPPALPPLA